MFNYLLYFSTLFLLLTTSRSLSQDATNTSLEDDLNELLEWFPGEYDNHQQVYKEAVSKTPKDRKHRQTHHIFHSVELDFIAGRTLYAQQSQHYNLNDIYRQRIYAFTIDEEEQAIRLTIYTPKSPEKFKNAHLNPAFFKTLSKNDFVLKPGCDVFWKKNKNQFEGYLKENSCSYFSKKFNTQVYLNETLVLRKDALLLNDTAVDENGKLVFGVNDKGPTINLKEKPCNH
jgi:hypothetical protein